MTQDMANQVFLEMRLGRIDKISFSKGFEEFERIYEDWKEVLERTELDGTVTIRFKTK